MSNILKYQNPNSPLFNPHKIIENVPAREWGPRKINEDGAITEGNGTKFSHAPFQYWGNKGLGSQNEKLARDLVSEFDQMRSENPDYNYILDKNYQSYDDAINYLNHLEGLKKYLQIPYDTGLLMESEYKPTRLQGTNEKTYKFKSSTVPGYWDDVVDDMVIGEHDKNQYYDQSLNEFTAYRDRDEKGDFVSIYDEWDYNPAVRGGNKKLNKVVDSVTGGKPFVIYDRIYLDDHYDVPEEARGNPFITPAVVTANAKHENGGILKAQNGTPYGLPGGVPSYMQVQPLSPVGIALNQAKIMAKMKGEQQYLPPGVKEVVGPDGKKVTIRTEQPLQPLEQSIAEWLPGTGDVAEVGYIANDVKNGNLGSAALAAAMVALPGNTRKMLDKLGVRVEKVNDVPIFVSRISEPDYYGRVSESVSRNTERLKNSARTSSSKLSLDERLGIPKSERNQKQKRDIFSSDNVPTEKWDEAYFNLLRKQRLDRAQKLVDKHFLVKTPGNRLFDPDSSTPLLYYHVSDGKPFFKFDKTKAGQNWKESLRFGRPGMFVTPDWADKNWGEATEMVFHLYDKTPRFNARKYDSRWIGIREQWDRDEKIKRLTTLSTDHDGPLPMGETVVFTPRLLKFAAPITFDDAGDIIPLSQRHDFKIHDFRRKSGGKL